MAKNLWSRHKFHITIYKGHISIKIKAEIYTNLLYPACFILFVDALQFYKFCEQIMKDFKLWSSPTYLHKSVGYSYIEIQSH